MLSKTQFPLSVTAMFQPKYEAEAQQQMTGPEEARNLAGISGIEMDYWILSVLNRFLIVSTILNGCFCIAIFNYLKKMCNRMDLYFQ